MYYVKCSYCGQDNEVKSEYLTFCQSCQRKLDQNFQDYSKRFPEKSFDEYLQENCTRTIQNAEPKQEKSDISKYIRIVLILAVSGLILIGIVGGIIYFNRNKIITPVMDNQLRASFKLINKSCPIMVGNGVRMDSIQDCPNLVLKYYFSLLNVESSSLNIQNFKDQMEPSIINTIKTNASLKTLRVLKMTFNYYFKDKNGNYFLTITVPPEKYQ